MIDLQDFSIGVKHKFHKDPTFCGRTGVLDKIKQIFGIDGSLNLRSCKIITLHGIGGIGKSQICSEYAHTQAGAYSAIFWITANTSAEVDKSALEALEQIIKCSPGFKVSNFQQIAATLNCADLLIYTNQGLKEAIPKSSAIEVLKEWLSKKHNDRWLLIVDNYNKSPSSYDLTKILPTSDTGHVLVNTRNLSPGSQNPIAVPEKLSQDDGIELLKSLTNQDCLLIPSIQAFQKR